MIFSIEPGGLQQLTAKLPILPNRFYPLGASSSPDTVFVEHVDSSPCNMLPQGYVFYRHHPYFGATRQHMDRRIFDHLCSTACRTEADNLKRHINNPDRLMPIIPQWMTDKLKQYTALLEGRNILPEVNLADLEPIKVYVMCSYPKSGHMDAWRYCEQYGSLTGLTECGKDLLIIHTKRETLNAIQADPNITVVMEWPERSQ